MGVAADLITLLDLFVVHFFSLIFLFGLCGDLSCMAIYIHVSFLLHVKYTVSHRRIVSYRNVAPHFR